MIRPPLRTALALAALLLPVALAQAETTGTLSGTVDGEQRTWTTYADTLGGQLVNTASFLGDGYTSITILAQTRPSVLSITEGGLLLSVESFTPPQGCPCTYEDASLTYFAGPGLAEDFYLGDATLTFDTWERLDEDTYRTTGTFRGVLAYRADMMTRADPDTTIEVAGSFVIDRLDREPEGE